ncbi:MAG: hypothetical protein GF393_12875 [Armatimonadia bacterium]|nr:hypothetical protein [Armatimonadia bacterium]
MSLLRKHICWRCGYEEDFETHTDPEFCPECGEPTIVRVSDLIDFANEMYLSNIVDNKLRLETGLVDEEREDYADIINRY